MLSELKSFDKLGTKICYIKINNSSGKYSKNSKCIISFVHYMIFNDCSLTSLFNNIDKPLGFNTIVHNRNGSILFKHVLSNKVLNCIHETYFF